jgi:hypothetical protein
MADTTPGRIPEAVEGVPVTPTAYLVVAGEYDDIKVICACADEGDAGNRADRWNRENFPHGEHEAARTEPVEFVPARQTQRAGPQPCGQQRTAITGTEREAG